MILRQFNEGGGEQPEIHGNQFCGIHRQAFALQVVAAHYAVFVSLDFHEFLHAIQKAVLNGANAAVHVPVVGEGVLQRIADHAVMGLAGFIRSGGQELGGLHKSVRTVKVIRIHYGKGFLHHVAGGTQGVGGAPGLFPAFRHGEAFRQVVQGLESVIHLNLAGKTAADLFLENIFKVTADNEYHFSETGPDGIINRVVKNYFPVGAHRVKLLETAVTAAHASC